MFAFVTFFLSTRCSPCFFFPKLWLAFLDLSCSYNQPVKDLPISLSAYTRDKNAILQTTIYKMNFKTQLILLEITKWLSLFPMSKSRIESHGFQDPDPADISLYIFLYVITAASACTTLKQEKNVCHMHWSLKNYVLEKKPYHN